MLGPSLGLLALVLLAVFAAAGTLVLLLGGAPQLRLLARARRASRLLAGVGLTGVAGGALALGLGGPGAIAWWWLAALLGAGLHWAEARLHDPADMSSGTGRFAHVLRGGSAVAGLVAALAAGALLHAQQAAEVLRDGLGLAPAAAGPLLAASLLALLAAARPARGGLLGLALLGAFVALALAALLADPAAAAAGLGAMVQGAWSADAAALGLLAGAAQAVLWSTLAAGPGLGAELRDDPAARLLAAPAGALVATLSALLVAASGDPAALTEPKPAALERHLGVGLQPSEYGQTIVIDPSFGLEPGQNYEVVLRSDPRGNRIGELLPADNIVAVPAWAALADTDAIILRDTDPGRAGNPGFDVRVPCTREIIKTRVGEYLKLRPLDPDVDLFKLMRARDLDGPFLPMADIHIIGSVRSGVAVGTSKSRTLLYEEPRPAGAPRNPPLRDLLTMGYGGPYFDPGGAVPAPPPALVSAADLPLTPGQRLHLRVDAPARGLELGFVNRLDELEVPPWDFLAGTSVALLRHKDDPDKDIRVPVLGRLAFGRLRFSSSDPDLSFGDLSAYPEHTGPFLLPPSSRFAVEVRAGTRLPPEFTDRRALIPLHTQTQGNPGAGLYAPHPAETLLAGMLGPVRDQTGAAQILPGLARRLGPAGAAAGALTLACLALAGLTFWLRLGQDCAGRVFGGGAFGLALLFLACVLVGPFCDPAAILRAALAPVALAGLLGLLALVLQTARLTRKS